MPGLEETKDGSPRACRISFTHQSPPQGKAVQSAVIDVQVSAHPTDTSCTRTLQCPQIAYTGELDTKASVNGRQAVLEAMGYALVP